ncbi:MAG: DUF2079 domain-containing protein [Polyangiaceae bacterium]|nr:DUF2079 domain-containing protein [Polyangiaceae bacterium]
MQSIKIQNEGSKVASTSLRSEGNPAPNVPGFRLASSAVVLGAALASTASTWLLLREDAPIAGLATANTLLPSLRSAVLKCLVISVALPCLVAGLAWFSHPRERARLTSGFERAARLSCPALLIWMVPALLERAVWDDRMLSTLLAFGLFTLGLERSLRVALPALFATHLATGLTFARRIPSWLSRFGPISCVVIAAASYATYTGYHSILQHHRLYTSAFDLAIYDNLMANGIRGDFFKSPVLFGPRGGNYIAGHANLVLVLYLPIYYLYQHAETLLVIQSVFLGGGAITLYLFASTQLPRVSACIISILYLLYAPLHGANFYDFHWITTSCAFQFLLYFAIARRRYWLMLGTLLLLFSIREDIPIGLSILGAFLIASGKRTREGATIFALSVPAFFLLKFVLMPWAGTWWFADLFKGLMIPGESGYGSVAKTIATNPLFVFHSLLESKKIIYWLHLAAPLGFLAYRRWGWALVASSGALMTLLTTDYDPTISISFHYTMHWVPYLFGVGVLALNRLEQEGTWWRASALSAVTVAVLIHSYHFGCIIDPEKFRGGFGTVAFRPLTAEESAKYQAMRELVAMIPKEASVSGTEEALPHASNRAIAYPLRMWTGNADYLLVAKRTLGLGNTRKGIRQAVENGYGLLAQKQGIYLFKRAHKSDKTAQALIELGI